MVEGTWVSGYVKKWFPEKGYGFVALPQEADAFLHITTLPESLKNMPLLNMDVEVIIGDNKKGTKVLKIRIPE